MIKMLNATSENSPMSGLTAIQPNHDPKLKMKRPETTALVIHEASVAKSKYTMSATLANRTINPYIVCRSYSCRLSFHHFDLLSTKSGEEHPAMARQAHLPLLLNQPYIKIAETGRVKPTHFQPLAYSLKVNKGKLRVSDTPGGIFPKSLRLITSLESQTIAVAPLTSIQNSKLNLQNCENLPPKIRDL
jgi:hypothetical protein